MKVGLDTSVLVAAFGLLKSSDAESMARKRDGADLLRLGPREGLTFVVPSLVLAEYTSWIPAEIRDSAESRITQAHDVCGFDLIASRIAAHLHRHATRTLAQGREATRQSAKLDCMILASAVAYGCDAMCYLDGDYPALVAFGIKVGCIRKVFQCGAPAEFITSPTLGLPD